MRRHTSGIEPSRPTQKEKVACGLAFSPRESRLDMFRHVWEDADGDSSMHGIQFADECFIPSGIGGILCRTDTHFGVEVWRNVPMPCGADFFYFLGVYDER